MLHAPAPLASDTIISASWVDYLIVAIYFGFVLGIGLMARRGVSDSVDFFLSGRSLPAWVTGLAFISANLGAVEIMGMSASGAEFGLPTVHYFWVGAIPAMLFLGIVMMPFYYGSQVRSVPEFMLRRFGTGAHLVNAVSFAVAQLLIAGINLYLLGSIIQALLGLDLFLAVVIAAVIVLCYITLGGLSAAIYNEVLQFFVIVAALTPLTLLGLDRVGGWQGVKDGIADSISSARKTPIIGAFPKMFVPFITIIPGMIAAVLVAEIAEVKAGGDVSGGAEGSVTYNDSLIYLMRDVLPNGLLGVAIAGLLAAFMAGMAANVSAFNTVFSVDLWERYAVKDRSDGYYLRVGRWATVGATVVAVFTAQLAASFSNIMDYLQTLFGFFNAPLFATFILGMFWKRMTATAGWAGLASGTLAAVLVGFLAEGTLGSLSIGVLPLSGQGAAFVAAGVAFAVDIVVSVAVSLVTTPKPAHELVGLVYSETPKEDLVDEAEASYPWYRRPLPLAGIAAVLTIILNLAF